MDQKEIIDIENIKEEFEKLQVRLQLISDRFLAVAMDYKHYIDNSFNEDKIYELRDNVLYRFFSAKVHVELLLRQHHDIEIRLIENFNKDPASVTGNHFPINPLFDNYQKEVSSIFDSFIYHSVSVFDYISTLTNYISSVNKEGTLMWTQLANSVRDKKSKFGKRSFASLVDNIDREFVNKLYNHRAFIIHRKADLASYYVTLFLGSNERIEANFLAGKNLINSFKELKELSKDRYPTVKYVAFWVINKTLDKVTDILFSLKEEMEKNPITNAPSMFYLDPKTNQAMPVSINYWHEDLYYADKKK